MSNAKQKAESTGVFSLHPSPAPRLCVNSSSPVGVAKHRLILYWNTAVLLFPFTHTPTSSDTTGIGRLPYYYFLLLINCPRSSRSDWKTAVLLLPFTPRPSTQLVDRLEDCRIYTSFYLSEGLEVCYLIGRLPYLYFLLLHGSSSHLCADWKTAVFILPSTHTPRRETVKRLEDCRIYTSFYLSASGRYATPDWKTAVFILPFTQ